MNNLTKINIKNKPSKEPTLLPKKDFLMINLKDGLCIKFKSNAVMPTTMNPPKAVFRKLNSAAVSEFTAYNIMFSILSILSKINFPANKPETKSNAIIAKNNCRRRSLASCARPSGVDSSMALRCAAISESCRWQAAQT